MATKTEYLTFAKASGYRALRTFFQTLVAVIPTASILLGEFDWKAIIGAAAAAGGAALLSVLNSLATGLPEEGTTVQGSTIIAIGRHAAPDEL